MKRLTTKNSKNHNKGTSRGCKENSQNDWKSARRTKNHLSKRGERIKLRLAKIHRKVHNQRMNFIHKLTLNLVKRFDCICLEDLNVKGMMQNHNLANSIGDVS